MGDDVHEKTRRRIERIRMFQEELAQLEQEGALVLTREQRSSLDVHLDCALSGLQEQLGVDSTDPVKRVSWGMKVTALLGGAALLAAAVLFVHRFWGELPTTIQVIVLTLAPLGLLAATSMMSARGVSRYYVGLLSLAAGVVFVMELNALGSVLNLEDSPQALLAWGLFALLVAYAHGLRLLLGVGLVLLGIYSAALVSNLQGYDWIAFPMRAQLLIPGALVLYAIPWFTMRRGNPDFDLVYRACGAVIGLGALLLLSTVGDLCCGDVRPGMVAAMYQIGGLCLSGGVVFHGLRLGQRGLVNLGAAGFLVFLFIRLHSWWWQWMPKYLFFLMIGLIAIGLLLVFRRLQLRPTKGARI